MEPLKEMFNSAYFAHLASEIKKVYSDFDDKSFLKKIQSQYLDLELNQRLRLTSTSLKEFLPSDFRKAIAIQKAVIPYLKRGYTNLVFPDYVALYGKHDLDFSLSALKFFTAFGSSEFAIREFLKQDFTATIREMTKWAKDRNHHVRRLASEGSRPRLPWSFRLDCVIKDPTLTLPILDCLKDDPELYVRKSVANHLNDISKDHPDLLLKIVKEWKGQSEKTDWILKHASRTLLKRGDKKILASFGVKESKEITLKKFSIAANKIKVGEKLHFDFVLKSSAKKAVKTRLEYAVYFKVASGKLSRKVFQIATTDVKPSVEQGFSKAHKFVPITTRKYYSGVHQIGLIINGKEIKTLKFELI